VRGSREEWSGIREGIGRRGVEKRAGSRETPKPQEGTFLFSRGPQELTERGKERNPQKRPEMAEKDLQEGAAGKAEGAMPNEERMEGRLRARAKVRHSNQSAARDACCRGKQRSHQQQQHQHHQVTNPREI
jgi:hypothetical protein